MPFARGNFASPMTKVGLIQLGCPKNHVDGEEMLGALALASPGECEFVSNKADADVLIVNTCAFIDKAKEESVAAILDALRLKERGRVRRVVVTGCLAQRYGSELAQELPGVDSFLGIESARSIGNVVFGPRPARRQETDLTERYPLVPHARLRAGATPWTAYLKISEGCDHGCAFCSIPTFRGKHRSKPIERLVDEAGQLAASGAREINLVAQDTTAYGMDLYRKLALPDLLQALSRIEGLEWIRLLYCYPTMVTDRLIEAMTALPKVLPYIDIPLQHADNAILRAMKRGGNSDHYRRLIERLRAEIPNLALRTTFIVGFPGEGEKHFERLLSFVREMAFDRAGVFVYSSEENTAAHLFEGTVPRKGANERRDVLMRAQQEISLIRNRACVGQEMDVLIEERHGETAVGRSFRDAPEIDGTVVIEHCSAPTGSFARARVIDARAYDLIAEQA